MVANIKIEVWEEGNPFNSAEKYYNSQHPNDFNKEVEKLLEQIKTNETNINERVGKNKNTNGGQRQARRTH